MLIELKNLKHAAFASEETLCFSATVYIDGKKAGEASNDGRGGCNRYHPWSLQGILDEHAKTLPPEVTKLPDLDNPSKAFTFQPDADSVITNLVSDMLAAKDLRRAMSSKILLATPDGKEIRQTKSIGKERLAELLALPDVATHLRCPGARVLNLLSFEEALALYLAAGTR